MVRYKDYSYSQGKFIPIHFSKQILPGTFEYTLNYLSVENCSVRLFQRHSFQPEKMAGCRSNNRAGILRKGYKVT
jgi:hypothetical protein